MRFRKLLGVFALMAASISTAHAVPWYWSDLYNPEDFTLSAPFVAEVPHDITDVASGGYRPGIDSVWVALLTIKLTDDATDSSEYVRFSFDGSGWTWDNEVDSGETYQYNSLFNFSASRLWDGLLNLRVQATAGDFVFRSSQLEVWGNRATTVAEPATLSLLGLGLLCLGLMARRRAQRGR